MPPCGTAAWKPHLGKSYGRGSAPEAVAYWQDSLYRRRGRRRHGHEDERRTGGFRESRKGRDGGKGRKAGTAAKVRKAGTATKVRKAGTATMVVKAGKPKVKAIPEDRRIRVSGAQIAGPSGSQTVPDMPRPVSENPRGKAFR
jgi:hypothetical protein